LLAVNSKGVSRTLAACCAMILAARIYLFHLRTSQ
jgi:hypothetical protein